MVLSTTRKRNAPRQEKEKIASCVARAEAARGACCVQRCGVWRPDGSAGAGQSGARRRCGRERGQAEVERVGKGGRRARRAVRRGWMGERTARRRACFLWQDGGGRTRGRAAFKNVVSSSCSVASFLARTSVPRPMTKRTGIVDVAPAWRVSARTRRSIEAPLRSKVASWSARISWSWSKRALFPMEGATYEGRGTRRPPSAPRAGAG
jgi:hypothetical protein